MKNRSRISVFIFLFLCCLTSSAQETTPKEEVKSVTQLTQEYRFEEAMNLLRNQIDEAREQNAVTTLLEEELKKVRIGADMLRGVEKVVFVDSVVVPREHILNYYKIGNGSYNLVNVPEITAKSGRVACVNDFGDRAILSLPDSSGILKLHALCRLGEEWLDEGELRLSANAAETQDYPFLLQDGLTLYYAAQGEESLGGFDIFVTRYDTEDKSFLRPENIGMPFNSPGNDYLFALDETKQIGFFATDRNQSSDSVCIYYFIPTDSREVYDYEKNPAQVRQMARLVSVKATQVDSAMIETAQKRWKKENSLALTSRPECFIVIDDNRVCTSLSQLHSEQAKRIASQWISLRSTWTDKVARLDRLRKQYVEKEGNRGAYATEIFKLEQEISNLEESICTMEANIRNAELKTIKQ